MRPIDADILRSELESWGMNDYEPLDFIEELDDAPTLDVLTRQQISQIKYEIYQEVGNIDRSQYTTERAQGRADGIIFALGMVLGIIGKYCGSSKGVNNETN